MRPFATAFILILLLSAGWTQAEGEDRQAPQRETSQAASPGESQPAPAAAEPAKKPEDETYSYTPEGRRDPFFSLIRAAKATQQTKKKILIPLEEYDISQFKLIAVVINSQKYALVALPNGKHYALREGTTVGTRGGKVTKITKDSVTARETITDLRGKQHANEITLKLRQEEE